MKIRQETFKSMLRQDQAWFDKNENSVNNLTTFLSRDSDLVHGAMGGRLGTVLQSLTTLAVSIAEQIICCGTVLKQVQYDSSRLQHLMTT